MGNETSYARDLEIDIGEYAVKVPEDEIPLVMKFADDKRDDEQKEQARKAAENQEKVEEQQKLFLKKALALNNLSLMLNNNNNNNSNLHLGSSSKLLTSGRGLSSPRLFSRGGGGGDSNSSGSGTFRHFSFNSGNSRSNNNNNNSGGGGGGSRSRSNSFGQQQQPNDFTGNPISDRDSLSDSSSENSSSFSMTPTYSTHTSSVNGVSMSQQQQQPQTKQPFLPKLNISDMADRLNEADLEMNGSGTPRKTSRFLGSARNIASLITPRKSMKANVALSNNSRSRSHSTASHISDYYPNIVLEKTEDIQTMDFTDRSERDEMSSCGDEAPQIMRGGRELSSLFSSMSSSQTFTASPFLKTNLESSLQFTDAESVSSEGESDSDTSDDELESELESEIGTPVLTPNSHEVFSTPKRNRFSQVGNSPELSDRSSFTNDNDSSTNKRDSKLNRLSRRFVQSVRGLPGLAKVKKEKKSKSESKGKSSGQILFDKYFSLEKRETLIQYMNSLLTGRELQKARKLIRNEICAIDPNCDHARKMIQHEIRNGRIDNAMDIIHHHNYLRVPVPCEESEFEDALGNLSPNFIPSILSFRNFLAKQKKRQQMELAISNNKRALADYENDDFDNVAVVELIIKWIQVILHKHDPNSSLKISNILTLKELNYMYMIIDNHYRFPFPLSQAELEQNQAKLADQTQANCYIHTSLVISMSYKILKQLQTQRKEDIEKLQCTQSATATTTVVVYVADLFSNVTTVQAVIRRALCENGVSNFKRLSSHIIAKTQRQMSTNNFIQISPILSKAKQYFVAQSKKTSFRTCSILLRVNSSAVRTNELVDTLKLNACSMRCLVQQSHIHHSSQLRTIASSVRTRRVIADHVFPDDIRLLQAQVRVHEQRGDQILLIQRVMRGGKGVLEHADNFRRVICVESTIRTCLIDMRDIAWIRRMISIIQTLTKANEYKIGDMISPIQTTAASASVAVCETISFCTTVQSVLRGRCENLNFRSIQSLQATIRSTISKKNLVFLWIERAQDEIEDDFHLSFSASFRPIGLKQVAAQQSIVEQTHLLQATLKQKFERFMCPFTKVPLLNDQHSELTQYVIMLQSMMRSEERDIMDSMSRLQATLTSYGARKVSLARELLIAQSFLRTCLYLRSDMECTWLQSNIRRNTVRHIDQFGMLQHLIRGASKSIDEARTNCNKLIGAAIRVGLSRTSNTEVLRLQAVIRNDNTLCRFWHAKAVQSVFRVRSTDFFNIRHIQSVIRMKSLLALCGDSHKLLDELTYLNSVMIVQALVRRRSEDPAPISTIQAVIRKTRCFRSVSSVSVLQALVKPQFDPSTLSWLYASVKQSITPPFDTIQVDTLRQLIISRSQRYNRHTLDSFTIVLQSLIRSVILSYQQNYGTIHAIARMNTINSQGGLMEVSVLQSFMTLCTEQLTSAQFGCQLSSLQSVVRYKSQINSSDLSTQVGLIQAIFRRCPPNTLALILPTIQKSAQSQVILSKIRDIQDIFRSKSVPIGPCIMPYVTLESQIRTQGCRSEHLTSKVIVLESLLRSNPIYTQHLQDLVSVQSLIRLKSKQQGFDDTLSSMLRMYIDENNYYARSIEIDRLHSIVLSPSLLSFQEIDVIQANILRYFVETSKNSLGMIQHCIQLRSMVTQVEILQSSIRLFNILLHNSGRHSGMLMLQNIFRQDNHPIDESCTALEQMLPIESIMRSNTITPVISQLADGILPILSIMRKNNHDHNSDVLNASIRMKSTHNKEVESLSAIQILSAHHLSDYNLCSHMQRLHDTKLIQCHIRSLRQEIRTQEALVIESSIRSLPLLPFNSVLSLQSMIRLKLHPHVSLSTLIATIQLRLFRLEIVNSSVERIQSLIIACPSNNIRMVRAIQAVFVEKLVALSTGDLNLSPTQGLEHSREVRIIQGAFRARSFVSDHSHSYLITNLLTGLITRTNILTPSIHDKITGVLTIDSIVRSRAVELGHSTLSPHMLSIQSAARSQPARDVSCEKLCSVFRSLLSTHTDAWVGSLQSIIRSNICITQCCSEYANTVAIESMMHKNEVNNAFRLARIDLMRIESILHSDTLALDLSSSKMKHIQALMKRECRTTEIIRSQALVLNVIHRTAAAQHMLRCVAIVQSAVHSRICVVDYSSRRESVLALIDILGNDNPSTHQNLTMNTKVSAIASVIRTQSCALSHIKLIQSVIGMRMRQFSLYDVLRSVIRMCERKSEHLIVLTEQRQLSSLISMKLITPTNTQYLSDTQSLQSLARLSLVQSDYEMWNAFKLEHLGRALTNHLHSVHGLQPLFGVIRTCQTQSDLVSQHQRIDTLQAILRQNKFICSNRNLNIISRCTAIQATVRMRTATDTVCSFAHIPPILERYLINSRVKLICQLCTLKDDQTTSVSRLQSIMRGAVNASQYQEETLRTIQSTLQRDNYMNRFLPIQSQLQCHLLDMGSITQLQAAIREHALKQPLQRQTSIIQANSVRLAKCLMLGNVSKHLMAIQASRSTDPLTLNNTKQLSTIQNLTITNLEERKLHYSKDSLGVVESAIRTMSVHVTDPVRDTCCVQAMTRKENVLAKYFIQFRSDDYLLPLQSSIRSSLHVPCNHISVIQQVLRISTTDIRSSCYHDPSITMIQSMIRSAAEHSIHDMLTWSAELSALLMSSESPRVLNVCQIQAHLRNPQAEQSKINDQLALQSSIRAHSCVYTTKSIEALQSIFLQVHNRMDEDAITDIETIQAIMRSDTTYPTLDTVVYHLSQLREIIRSSNYEMMDASYRSLRNIHDQANCTLASSEMSQIQCAIECLAGLCRMSSHDTSLVVRTSALIRTGLQSSHPVEYHDCCEIQALLRSSCASNKVEHIGTQILTLQSRIRSSLHPPHNHTCSIQSAIRMSIVDVQLSGYHDPNITVIQSMIRSASGNSIHDMLTYLEMLSMLFLPSEPSRVLNVCQIQAHLRNQDRKLIESPSLFDRLQSSSRTRFCVYATKSIDTLQSKFFQVHNRMDEDEVTGIETIQAIMRSNATYLLMDTVADHMSKLQQVIPSSNQTTSSTYRAIQTIHDQTECTLAFSEMNQIQYAIECLEGLCRMSSLDTSLVVRTSALIRAGLLSSHLVEHQSCCTIQALVRSSCVINTIEHPESALLLCQQLLTLQAEIRSSLHVPCNHICVIQSALSMSITDVASSPTITMIQSMIRSASENSIRDKLTCFDRLSVLFMPSEPSRVLDICQIQSQLRNPQAEQSKINDQLAVQSSIRSHSYVCTTKSIETLQNKFSQMHNRIEDTILGIGLIQSLMAWLPIYQHTNYLSCQLSKLQQAIRSSTYEPASPYRAIRNIHDQTKCILSSSEMNQTRYAIECLEGLCQMKLHDTPPVDGIYALISMRLLSDHSAEYQGCCTVQALTHSSNVNNKVKHIGTQILTLQSTTHPSLQVPFDRAVGEIQSAIRMVHSNRHHDPNITMIQSVIRSASENSIHDMLTDLDKLSTLFLPSEPSGVLDICRIQAHLRYQAREQIESPRLYDQLVLQSSIRTRFCLYTTKSIDTLQSKFSQVHNRTDEDAITGIETIQAIMRSNALYIIEDAINGIRIIQSLIRSDSKYPSMDTVTDHLYNLQQVIHWPNCETVRNAYRSIRSIHDQTKCTLALNEMTQIQYAIEGLEGLCRMSSHDTSLVVRTSALFRAGLQSSHPVEYHDCCEIQALLRSSCASNKVEHIGTQILTLQSRIRSSLHPPHNHTCSIQSAIRMSIVDVQLSGYHDPNITVIQSMIRSASGNSIHDMLTWSAEQSKINDQLALQSSIRAHSCVYTTKSIEALQSIFLQVHNRMDEDAITDIETIQALLRSTIDNSSLSQSTTSAGHENKTDTSYESNSISISSTKTNRMLVSTLDLLSLHSLDYSRAVLPDATVASSVTSPEFGDSSEVISPSRVTDKDKCHDNDLANVCSIDAEVEEVIEPSELTVDSLSNAPSIESSSGTNIVQSPSLTPATISSSRRSCVSTILRMLTLILSAVIATLVFMVIFDWPNTHSHSYHHFKSS